MTTVKVISHGDAQPQQGDYVVGYRDGTFRAVIGGVAVAADFNSQGAAAAAIEVEKRRMDRKRQEAT